MKLPITYKHKHTKFIFYVYRVKLRSLASGVQSKMHVYILWRQTLRPGR